MTSYARGTLAVAICDRCGFKRKYTDLTSDPNSPGLRVCRDTCMDQLDPYRLPQRQPEAFVLRNPRPDQSVASTQDVLAGDEDNVVVITTEDGDFLEG